MILEQAQESGVCLLTIVPRDCTLVLSFLCLLCLQLKKKFVGEKEMIQYCVDENYRQYLPQETRADFGDSILKEIGRMKLDKKEDG